MTRQYCLEIMTCMGEKKERAEEEGIDSVGDREQGKTEEGK